MLLIYVIVAAAIPPLFYAPSAESLKVFAFLFGVGLGGDYMIIPLMAADLYGVAIMGRVMGIVLTADSVAESLVPMLVASLRDATGSYQAGFLVLVTLAAIGALAVSFLPVAARSGNGNSDRVRGRGRAATGDRMTLPLFDLTGRVAVVVGGTSGIGRALALGLAMAGADVVATGRRRDLVATAAQEIAALGRRTVEMAADVDDAASLIELRDACLRELGTVDILVAAAGVTKRVPTLQMRDEDWARIIDTNLTGVVRACQIFGAPMVEQQRGRIITIASIASFVGLHEVAAYTASKAGVAGLTRALAVEWAPHGVTVNAIAPGVFETDLNRELLKSGRGQEFLTRTPMKRFGRVEELVGAAVFLASDASSFMTGQLVAVDGGLLASGVNV